MSKYIIIRANANGGKTTTAGVLFEELRKIAEFSKIYDNSFKELNDLQYSEEGNLYDFIGIIILDGKVIVIISRGDVADDLKELLDKLLDETLVKEISDDRSNKIDIIVCCARSQFRKNSTIEMLHNRIDEKDRFEFWTTRSEDFEKRKDVKMDVVKKIIEEIIK